MLLLLSLARVNIGVFNLSIETVCSSPANVSIIKCFYSLLMNLPGP